MLKGFLVITVIIAILHQIIGEEIASSTTLPIALPDCPDKCGNVPIPYPFGIGDGCHYNHPEDGLYYKITCNSSSDPVVPTYGVAEVKKITLDGEFQVRSYISYICYASDGAETDNFTSWISVTRFALSTTQNIVGAIGCDTLALFSGTRMNITREFKSGCVSWCDEQEDVSEKCNGIGCCLGSIPDGVSNITLTASTIYRHTEVQSFNPCSVAFVVAKDQFQVVEKEMPFSIPSILTQDVSYFENSSNLLYPRVYNWSIGTKDCATAKAAGAYYLCKGNSKCFDNLPGQWGYRCQCNPGYHGNPYLDDCQDIDECADDSLNTCEKQQYCSNTPGKFICTCPRNFSGNGTKESH